MPVFTMNATTPHKPRPPPGQQGSTPFRSASASRFRSSLVPMNKPSPARTSRLTGKLAPTTNPSYGRDLFRTNTPQTVRTTKFAPTLPTDATKMTPSARKFTQKSTSGGMTGIASTELFKMRIPSPDPELSGEALSKEVPDDPHRKGTIYADQFLAHKCPQNFDDLQRRQFFCILDLRRLKYAANEIFAKKDWKLNIMNFAKEYEKSRGLIMLRYGLYEFKNVKPSEEVLKRWRATHNLPEPEPQDESVPTAFSAQSGRRLTGANSLSTKRKAEDDLTPKDNALMASTANQNKRRNLTQEQADPVLTGPAPFKKSKRKADDTDEPDENQPSKVQKPTPSAAKSKFESILNRTQSGSTSPIKRASLAPFGTPKPAESQNSSFASKSNPFASFSNGFKPASVETVKDGGSSGSVLAGQDTRSTPAKTGGNIFSYLSESSANSSGNENDNADEGDTESESEEEESPEAPPSDQPNGIGSAATSTPSAQSDSAPFAAGKPSATTFGLFSQSNKDLEANTNSKGGLFGRVQMGSNGQPLRAPSGAEEQTTFASTEQPPTESQQTKTPTQRPGDYTFNAATTPISFGSATTSKPESSSEPDKSVDTSTAKPTMSLFGAGAPTNAAFQPSAASASIFNTPGTSTLSQAKTDGTANSLFSAQKSTPSTSKLFGGVQKADEKDSSAEASKPPSAPKEPSPIFGASSASTTAPTPTTKSLFGNSQANGGTGSQSIFASAAKPSASNLFGGSSNETPSFGTSGAKVNGSSTTKSLFDTPAKQPSASFTFGSSKPETPSDTPKPSNGPSQTSSSFNTTTPKPIFSSEATKPTTTPAASSIFGNNSTTPAALFGTKNGEATPAEKKPAPTATPSLFSNNSTTSTSLFGFRSGNAAPAEKKDEPSTTQPASSFGSTTSAGPSFTFGAQSTAPTVSSSQTSTAPSIFFGGGANGTQANGGEPKKPEISFGGSTAGSGTTPFAFSQGPSSSGTGFTFTAGGNGQSFNNPFASPTPSPSVSMFADKPSTPAPASTFNFSFGQQAPSTPNPAPASQGFSFGASSNATNGAPSLSFTTATPPQNNANLFSFKSTTAGSMGSGSFLQASGDTGASKTSLNEQGIAGFANPSPDSPFPAPSSIGTTPVNGTPEPQTQNEDGEEAPQEQLSLTNGGPGEEDEIILHEVRAKAIKFIPIRKGEDEEENKSPWTTQGVGPLRVLKNKTTGTVRVLLRAEPRGHIAMNKALLSDIEYKSTEKTVNFAAASDDGKGLETWVLQVKKPDFAQELVRVLEQNKGANKK